ncbi:precorrin-3B C(17)-methyltransferase [Candidatus Electronema sp. PJ]|uniref:precorrin-3B C(17)-methyltransferase n=1 Tax=Candidatus Electronema sp. PJ TaxID=3401572 RepID=UPI003AA8B4AB
MKTHTSRTGTLVVVGIGPGAADLITPRARLAIVQAEVIAGYRTYLDLITDLLRPEQEILASSMMQEVDRCRGALALAENGRNVALICGGDPGIYAMAGLVYELVKESNSTCHIDIIPGIAALNACAAVLGAPLMHDFAAISLSDLMTPWPLIEKRLQAAAAADFVTVLYNPKSGRRIQQIVRAQEIMLEHRAPATPVGIVSGAGRAHESVRLTNLEQMLQEEIGMQTTVIIGNSSTFVWQDKMVTPRGYANKYDLGAEKVSG